MSATTQDVAITWPKNRTLQSYFHELERAVKRRQKINFRVPSAPTRSIIGGRCYAVYDGFVVGWNRILAVTWRSDVIDPVSRAKMPPGWYIEREPSWHAIAPIPMRGFRGYRYVELRAP